MDALPISRIRDIFVDGLRTVIDNEKAYHRDLAGALVNLLIWEVLEPQIEQMRRSLREAVDARNLVENLQCPADIVAQFARAGASYINPLEYDEYVFNAAGEIRSQLQRARKKIGRDD